MDNKLEINDDTELDEKQFDSYIKVLILYGKLMLESNYGASEVRNNLIKMMYFMKINYFSFFITTTSLMLVNQKTNDVKMINVKKNSYNFEKMGHIKAKVDAFFEKKIDADQLYKEFKKIDNHSYAFPFYVQVFSAGLICGSMYVLIAKLSLTALVSLVLGVLGYIIYLLLEKYINITIFSVFLYSTFISLVAVFLAKQNIADDSFSLILSCMMPLLPGATFVNAIRASIDGDYLTGLSQASEAINTALMLGLPVAFILTNL